MSKIFYVYAHLDPRKPGNYKYGDYQFDFEPFYIGKGKNGRMGNTSNPIVVNKETKLIKLGLNPIRIKIVENISEYEAFNIEILLISLIGRLTMKSGPLANITAGGDGVCGRFISDEEKLGRSIRARGDRNPFYGKTHTESTLNKMRGYNHWTSRKDVSNETREKMRIAHTGKVMGEAQRLQLQQRMLNNNPMKGRNHSETSKQKQSESLKRTISNLDKHWNSGRQVSEDLKKIRSINATGSNNPCYGKKMYNNGIVNKYLLESDIHLFPGFVKGKLKRLTTVQM